MALGKESNVNKAEKRRRKIDAIKAMLARIPDYESIAKFIALVRGKSARIVVGLRGKRELTVPANVVQRAVYEIESEHIGKWRDVENWRPFITRAEVACAMMQDVSDAMFYALLQKMTGQNAELCKTMTAEFRKLGEHIVIRCGPGGIPVAWRWEKTPAEAKKGGK